MTLDSDKYPIATFYLVKAFKKLTGINEFTSLSVTESRDADPS